MSAFRSLLLIIIGITLWTCATRKNTATVSAETIQLRFATYNVALYRDRPGQLGEDLASGSHTQIKNVAAVIQQVQPDVLALLEFDYDPSGGYLSMFRENYLEKAQSGGQPIRYGYAYAVPSNTGLLSNADYNNDGKITLPEDAYGFGRYQGQYAFALLSKYPLDLDNVRSFQRFLWKDMPGHRMPENAQGKQYYSRQAIDSFRLSSKNHIDIPVILPNGQKVHTIISHPTPPVFDGPEDRNGLRNHDEIRLLADYISGADYLRDDQGRRGGLPAAARFVVMGDLNADPVDGDSVEGAIRQLLEHPRIHPEVALGDKTPASKGGKLYNKQPNDRGDPSFDTAFFGKRIDYVLPSKDMIIKGSGVFWPAEGSPFHTLIKDEAASDHLLVWVDVELN